MYKKIFTILCLLTTVVTVATAQHTPGSWRTFPMSGIKFERVLDTPSKVYYITGGSLYSYDKQEPQTKYYTPGSDISDTNITDIYYNSDGKYIVIAYGNGNIDLLYDDGRLVNMPDVKDATISAADKSVNDIVFDNNRIYAATAFGLVVFDDQKHNVVESGIYNKSLPHIMVLGDRILTFIDKTLAVSPVNVRHNSPDSFEKIGGVSVKDWIRLDKNLGIYIEGNTVRKIMFDPATGKVSSGPYLSNFPGAEKFDSYKSGCYTITSSGITEFDKDLNKVTTPLPSELDNMVIGIWNGLSSIWAADRDGIANYSLNNGTLTVLSDKYFPQSSQMFEAGYCVPSWDGASVHTSNMGLSWAHPSGDTWGLHHGFIIERYDWETGKFTPEYPVDCPGVQPDIQALYNQLQTGLLYGGPGRFAIDPVDPSLIYHTNSLEGLVIVKDQKVIYQYNDKNSPLKSTWGSRVMDAAFDNLGNLWVGHWSGMDSEKGKPYKILTADVLEKLRKDPTSVTKSDWISAKFPLDIEGVFPMLIGFTTVKSKNKALYMQGGYQGRISGYDTNGTTSVNDDKSCIYVGFLDQDGTVTNPMYRTCIIEDKTGNLWIGTNEGVYVVKDIDQIGNSSMLSVIRPKVARNDGTEYADYLLSTELILNIAVDNSNRKWIATKGSGLYLVDADGKEILQHFTKDNSPMLTNDVYSVACDPHGNDVLVGTPAGMLLYSGTSSPAADDYSSVIAYPNPVRPDYTGWITIQGLMENSLVKIADAQGNVIATGRSEGGMYIWDGCNSAGERVRSGVYMVFASQNSGDSSNGAVTKIVVIN